MEAIPGLGNLPAKIFSECGAIGGMLIFALVWVAWQLAKARKGWEDDRAEMTKIREADRTAMLKIIESHNEVLERVLLAAQMRRNGDRA